MTDVAVLKRQAAERAVAYVEPGMVVGLGEGSTAAFAVRRIAQLLREGDLHDVLGVPCSCKVEARAREHRRTVMIGRSHGIHAEPTTFGLKLLVYWSALRRGLVRLDAAQEEIGFGQLSGAVGTIAHLDPAVEAETMKRLGLKVDAASTQVVQRDRHAAWLAAVLRPSTTAAPMTPTTSGDAPDWLMPITRARP